MTLNFLNPALEIRQLRPDVIPTINHACELLAQRALANRTGKPVTDRRGWLAEVTHDRWVEHADRAADLLDAHPDLTPDQLADHLEPDLDDDEAAHLESLKITPEDLELRRQRTANAASLTTPEGQAAKAKVSDTLRTLRGGE